MLLEAFEDGDVVMDVNKEAGDIGIDEDSDSQLAAELANKKGVWKPPNASHYWNGRTVTTMWDAIWDDLRPYFLTETQLIAV